MATKFGKLMSRAAKKGSKKVRKNTKKLSKQLFGKNGLVLSHTYDSTVSLFKKGKESKPLYSVTRSGEIKVSVFKVVVISLCVISSVVLLALAIKAIIDHCSPKKKDDDEDYCIREYPEYEEELPF